MNLKISFAIVIAASVLGFTACSSKKDDTKTKKEFVSDVGVQAADKIQDSFGVVETQTLTTQSLEGLEPTGDKAQVSLAKSALEKEFLLEAAMIPQLPAGTGSSLRSRVVAFRLKNDHLYLMEATQGHSVSKDLPQNLILAEFPIIAQSETNIQFDFNEGMAKIFVMSNWQGQDFGGSTPKLEETFKSIPVNISYIESADLTKQNQLYIRQVAQVESEGTTLPMEARYWFSPYRPDPSYSPLISKDMNQFGFFEIAPQYAANGAPISYATKFDHKKPIVFAISENTPDNFKQAVRDGILYWNSAFGSEVIQAIDAPAGATAPDPDYNVVQWVTWDTAGFAYADASSDPRTGQTLRAQVFMTSVFGISGKETAAVVLRHLESDNKMRLAQFSLRGFESQKLCNLNSSENFADTFKRLVESGLSDDKIAKAAQDYVRDVVAHEIGHTLGLRHNFAGSLATNFPLSERDAKLAEYFATGKSPESVVVSNSVMDYILTEESFISGSHVAQKFPLKYDRAAIQRLYYGEKFSQETSPFFCTDSHVDIFADCATFDTGANLVDRTKGMIDPAFRMAARRFINNYILAQQGREEGQNLLTSREVLGAIIGRIMEERVQLISALSQSGKLLSHRFRLGWSNGWDTNRVRQGELDELSALMNGEGISSVWSLSPTESTEKFKTSVSKFLDENQSGYLFKGKLIVLSREDRRVIEQTLVSLTPVLVEEFALKNIASFATINWPDHEVSYQMARHLSTLVDHVLFANYGFGDSSTASGEPNMLPFLLYPFEVRRKAIALLDSAHGQATDWGYLERQNLIGKISSLLSTYFGETPKPETMTTEQRRFYLEQNRLRASF